MINGKFEQWLKELKETTKKVNEAINTPGISTETLLVVVESALEKEAIASEFTFRLFMFEGKPSVFSMSSKNSYHNTEFRGCGSVMRCQISDELAEYIANEFLERTRMRGFTQHNCFEVSRKHNFESDVIRILTPSEDITITLMEQGQEKDSGLFIHDVSIRDEEEFENDLEGMYEFGYKRAPSKEGYLFESDSVNLRFLFKDYVALGQDDKRPCNLINNLYHKTLNKL